MADKILLRPQRASDAVGRTIGTIHTQMNRVLQGTKKRCRLLRRAQCKIQSTVVIKDLNEM